MKLLDVAFNAAILLSATVFLAYIGFYYFEFGLFTTLPDSVAGIFIRNGVIQYVALGIFLVALTSKIRTGRALKKQEAEKRD